MAVTVQGEILRSDTVAGPVLRLRAPISFWGGVDPATGRIADPNHPDHGADIAGTILVLSATVGSSSSSAVMLELLFNGRAPAALLLGEPDAILALGVIVAGEMGYRTIPVLKSDGTGLATGMQAEIDADGRISVIE
jgi:predicted aconitase with swiveling domain